ncbi:MAG: BatD family protein [Deltaproteobacteria bacterium]|nr:BatD family protein [Deltaproteobacteria bacterium]
MNVSRAAHRASHATIVAVLSCALVSWLTASSARAQSGECRLAAETTSVVLGQVFRLEATCHAQGAEAGMPELDLSDFEVMSRQVSRPMQFTFGMGGQQQIVESTTRLALLVRARREGRFEVGPASAVVGGARISSGTITISVGGGAGTSGQPAPLTNPGAGQPSTPPGSNGPPSGPLDGAIYDDQAFLRTVVDRHEAVVGQQITVTFYLYVRSLATQPQITQQPSTDGFWVHDLLDRNAPPDAVMQRVGSTSFRVYTLRRFAAFPLREGELTIGAMEMHVPIGNPLDMIFGAPQADLVRSSVPVQVTVRPLPAGAAAGMPVHVGALSVESSLDRAQVPTGDAVTLDLHMTGRGQVDAISTPAIRIDGLRVLQPEIDQRTSVTGERVGGDRGVRWLLVPERPGTYTLGPFRWAVFDPEAQQWSTVEAPALTLVAAGNATQVPATSDPSDPSEPDAIDAPDADEAASFGPVRTSSAFARRSARLATTPFFAVGLGLGPLALLVTGLVFLARRRRAANVEAGAADRATRESRRKLDDAERAIGAKDTRAFYAAVMQSLKQILEVRLGRAVGSLTHAELKRVLVDRGMHAALALRVKDELEGAEMARFSAAGGEEKEMRSTLERARVLFTELQRFTPTAEDE